MAAALLAGTGPCMKLWRGDSAELAASASACATRIGAAACLRAVRPWRTSSAMRRSVHCSMAYRQRMPPMSFTTGMRSLTRVRASRPPSAVLHTHAISSGTRCWPAARRAGVQVAGWCAPPETAPVPGPALGPPRHSLLSVHGSSRAGAHGDCAPAGTPNRTCPAPLVDSRPEACMRISQSPITCARRPPEEHRSRAAALQARCAIPHSRPKAPAPPSHVCRQRSSNGATRSASRACSRRSAFGSSGVACGSSSTSSAISARSMPVSVISQAYTASRGPPAGARPAVCKG